MGIDRETAISMHTYRTPREPAGELFDPDAKAYNSFPWKLARCCFAIVHESLGLAGQSSINR
jgi:hypothetical protein